VGGRFFAFRAPPVRYYSEDRFLRGVHVNDRSTRDRSTASEAQGQTPDEQLVWQHYEHVFAVCYGILVNVHDAEDAAQETMLRGLAKGAHRMAPEQRRPWISRVARNLCIDRLRRRKRPEPPAEPPPAPSRQDLNAQQDLEQAIRRLPAELRVPLLMYYFDGRSAKAIAENLKVSHSGVCQRLRMARQQLHELLTEGPQK
jgi:RNA polymerase sigma-70 factor (ECF subfamily)